MSTHSLLDHSSASRTKEGTLDHAVRGGSGPGLSSFCILRMLKKVTLFLSVLKVPS